MKPGPATGSLAAGGPAVGEVIAQKYRVEALVGKGGMGVVVSARHVQLGQAVAIKLLTLPPDEERRDEAFARFLHEAQAAARLHSEHVVRIYDVGQLDSGLPFMVMELLAGTDLASLLDERGALPEAEAVDYVLQACAGVAEAHAAGIVHRDLKPSNLFVTRRSDGLPLIKVLDFGISKQLSDPSSPESLAVLTNTRTLMGSPHYMSPEQIRDARRVDARADVWALGIILQELITDAPVFHGESFPGVCAAIVADPPMPVRTMRPDVSEPLETIINRCLEKDVQRRFQSVNELAGALAPLGSRAGASGSGPQGLIYSSHPRLVAGQAAPSGTPRALPADPTVALAPPPESRHAPRDGTLESARLQPLGSTHSAMSSPDSRIERLRAQPAASAKSRSASRWLLPIGVGALLVVGALVLQSRALAPVQVVSGDTQAPSAPAVAAPTPFRLDIESQPPGASVSEGSVRLGTTPLSLNLSVPEGAPPRVLVVEKEGYEPYVLRQGPAHGPLRVVAPLQPLPGTPTVSGAATAASPAASAPAPVANTAPAPARARPPAAKRPAAPATTAKPPSDIRLER